MILYKSIYYFFKYQGCILKQLQPPADEFNFIHDSLGSLWWWHLAVQSVQNTQFILQDGPTDAGVCGFIVFGC